MKTRTTLILLGLFAAILGYWLLFERHVKPPEEAAQDAKRLFPAEGMQVQSLTIERPGAPAIKLARTGDRWRMTGPLSARAERWSADAAAGAILEITQTRSVTNDRGDPGLAEMGLSPPRARVTFTLAPKPPEKEAGEAGPPAKETAPAASPAASPTASAPQVLEIGGEIPTTDSVFARVPGRAEISVVPSSSVASLLRTAEELRDKSLLDTTALDVFEARIDRTSGESLRFRRREGEWWMEAPIQDAAEGAAVQGLLTALIGLRAESFEEAPDASRAEAPDATVRLFSEKGGSIAEIALGPPTAGDVPKRRVRVTAPGEPPVVALAAAADLSSLDGPPLAFRARHALIFRSWDATALNLTSPRVTLSFARKDGAWSAVAPASLKVSHDAVDATLQSLADLEIVGYDAAAGKPLSAMGLQPARTKVEVKLGEPSNRTLSLELGAPAGGPTVLWARAPGRPVFTVPASILERIDGGASLYEEKPLPPPQAPAGAASPSPSPHPSAPPAASGPAGSSQ